MPLDPAISWLLLRVPDPFSRGRVDNPWEGEPVDVESINPAAFQACFDLVREVRRSRESHGLLLTGAPGAGKTHLLSRLRARLLSEQFALFVYVLPVTAPERFFRHLLHAVGSDLLRPAPARPAVSQLEVALARHALGIPNASVGQCADYWAEARRLFEQPLDLLDHLRSRLEPALSPLDLEPGLVDVALRHASGVHRAASRAYLTGRGLSEAQLESLDVGQALDEEEEATLGLASLLRLCSEPVVLAFDQIEGLEASPGDDLGLMGFGNGLARLFARAPHNVAAITCVQVAFSQRLREVLGTALFEGRVAERRAELQPLDAKGAVELVEARLSAAPYLPDVRRYARELAEARGHAKDDHIDDRLWPLMESEVRRWAQANVSARTLLAWCRESFDRVRRGAPVEDEAGRPERPAEAGLPAAPAPDLPVAGTGPPPPNAVPPFTLAPAISTSDGLAELWQAERQRWRQAGVDLIDEGVYADGLLKAVEAHLRPGVRAERSRLRDIDLVLESGGERIGVAVCHAENMTSLAKRLGRLREARPANLSRVVVVRDARLPVSRTAVVTRRRLEQFRAEGALVTPNAEAYAALEALRELLSRSAAGDLELDGRTLPPDELRSWLARNPDPALEDLLAAVLGSGRASAELPPEVIEAMQSRLIAPLAELAERTGVAIASLRALAETPGSGLLLLAGPPAVVFLSPDLLERA